jgi:ABC-type glycerol-3-phosphate transport system substrate-binding protein
MRKISKLLPILIMVFVTCAGTSCSSKDNTVTKENTAGLKGSINILSNSRDAGVIKYAAESFTKMNPNVSINIKPDDKLNTGESISDTGELPDIFAIEDEYGKHFISSNPGKLMELSEVLNSSREKYLKWKLVNLSSGSSIYGCPWYTRPVAMFYRTDIFESEKINPSDIKTWDDFIEAGQKITKDINKKVLQNQNGTQYPLFKMLFLQSGNGLIDKEGKPSFNGDKAAASIKLVKRLQDKGLVSEYNSSSSFTQDIVSGNVACFVAGADGIEILKNQVPKQKGLWNVMMLPASEPGGNRTISEGGSSFFVSSSAKNKELALKFIKYAEEDIDLSSKEVREKGIFPANEILYDLKALNIPDEYFNNAFVWQMLCSVERLEMEVYYPSNYDTVNRLVEDAAGSVLGKNDDVKPPLLELQKQVENALK